MSGINTFLYNILSGINSIIGSYGWSIVIFTIIIKLLLLPLDLKSRRSMRRMSDLSPQISKLQKKYANDKDKLNQKTAELYRKEHISPLSGCLPMLLSFPVLIAMFGAMRMAANTELAKQTINFVLYGEQINQAWLWVQNLWMPDSPFTTAVAQEAQLKIISTDIWVSVINSLPADTVSLLNDLGISADTVDSDTYLILLDQLQNSDLYLAQLQAWSALPEIDFGLFSLSFYAFNNGYFILPLLAAATQFLTTLTQPQTASLNEGSGAAGNGKFMKYFFPLFSLYICSTYNAGFALYWVTANLIAFGEGIIINKTYAKSVKTQKMKVQEDSFK